MNIKKIKGNAYSSPERKALAGQGWEAIRTGNSEKSFDQYLLEAFQGTVIKEESSFSREISPLLRKNLIRLS